MAERKRTPRLVITFKTTEAIMALDMACDGDMGRIIPVPQSISAGCGLAWMSQPEMESDLKGIMAENSIEYDAITVVAMY